MEDTGLCLLMFNRSSTSFARKSQVLRRLRSPGGEGMPPSVFKLEHTRDKDRGNEHVEEIIGCDGL